MNVSIKHRIYFCALLFASLFIVNRIVAFTFLYKSRSAPANIVAVTDPSIAKLNDFRNMVAQTRMNSMSLVFVKANKDDIFKTRDQFKVLKKDLLQLSQ